MCLKQLVALLFLVFPAGCNDERNKRSDSASAGTDFVAFPPIPLGAQRVFQGPPDLTALQQTHVLGNFHHRFHPPRLGFNYASNPSQLLYVPQTHITPPQEQSQRSHQQGPVLRPPGPPPGPKLNAPFGSHQDQSIKNSFPSNAPHTIKFSISSQNYNPNQGRHFGNSAASPPLPPPKTSHPLTSGPTQGQRFVPSGPHSLGTPGQSPANQAPTANFQAPSNQFRVPSKNELGNFPNALARPAQPPFASPQVPTSLDASVQFTGFKQFPNQNARGEENNVVSGGVFSRRPGHASGGLSDLGALSGSQSSNHRVEAQAPLIQSSIELKQDDLFRHQSLDKQRITQTNFGPPKVETHESYTLSEAPAKQSFHSQDQRQQQHQLTKYKQNTRHNQFEHRTTESPRHRATAAQEERVSETIRSMTPPRPTSSSVDDRKLALEKSQDHLRFALNDSFLSKKEHSSNEIVPTATSAAPEFFTTVSTTFKKPKPLVKEITINLNDQRAISGGRGGTSPQLYAKEDRQEEFHAVKAKEEKEENRQKSEKSQEELINEQIRKLLQSHNLEIIGKDSEAQTNSQEVQLSKVSEQFKKYNYSVQLLNGGGLLSDLKPRSKEKSPALPPLPELPDHIKKQYDVKLVRRDELLKQFDISGDSSLANGSLTSGNVLLANGQNLEIVRFSKDGTMDKIPIGTKAGASQPPTTAKPPKVLFEELTKEVLPPGADFELIRHKGNGQVEKVEGLTGEKKVTFVFLEEQPDGSVKVQGIKGNSNDGIEESEDVDSLIKKIKNGSLKLPPSEAVKGGRHRNEIPGLRSTTEKTFAETTRQSLSKSASPVARGPTTEFVRSSPYSIDPGSKSASQSFRLTTPEPPTTFLPTLNHVRSSTRKPIDRIRSNFQNFLPTAAPTAGHLYTPTFGAKRPKSTSAPWHVDADDPGKTYPGQETSATADGEILSHRSTEYRGQRVREPQDVIAEESIINAVRPLNEVLKENGLNEMAKFLDQSGLNAILNETGPYTIFIPTDKAFKTLESQLGGPDKAEDKFRENPRLLSGLLLHHVVPGSFRVQDLQDEMTGVSLAGTQLRVNTYPADEKRSSKGGDVVTINGAKVSEEQKDIVVPQGLAHSIDRVLFPLPVGDIVQTLKSDRERRFTKFLKALDYSGLTDLLTGSKTYTVFAPTDKAFSVLTDAELEKLLTKREAAKTIALRHIVPGTLYTAGMNYFQVKDSMETGQKITIRKEIGKIKANSAQIVSANIPATNGVIHAVETLL